MNNNFFRITIFFSIFLLANLYSIKTSASNHKVLEINEARGTVTTLNKKYPKPQLENFGSQNKKSGTFNGQGCKGSKKNKSINFYKGNHTIDIFVACRITSPTGYHEQLRKVADKVAARYCKSEYSSKTYYRGRSFTSALDDKAWRLVGDVLSLGLLINKRTVALSYVCGDKYETYENDTNESNIDLSNKSTRRLCEQSTLLSGDWSPYKKNYKRELVKRNISLEYCNSLTGRGKKVIIGGSNVVVALDLNTLCLRATTKEGLWESSYGKFSKYVNEINRRGISLVKCNKITGRDKNNSDYLIVIIFVIFILILVIYLKSLNKRANAKQAKEQRTKEHRVKEEQAKEQRTKGEQAKQQQAKAEQAKEKKVKNEEESEEGATADVKDFLID